MATYGQTTVVSVSATGALVDKDGVPLCRVFTLSLGEEIGVYIDFLYHTGANGGRGAGKRFVAQLLGLLGRASTISGYRAEVALQATSKVGGYFWATQGFRPVAWSATNLVTELYVKLQELVASGRPISDRTVDEVLSLARAGKMRKLARYSGEVSGKELLLGTDWNGVLHISTRR